MRAEKWSVTQFDAIELVNHSLYCNSRVIMCSGCMCNEIRSGAHSYRLNAFAVCAVTRKPTDVIFYVVAYIYMYSSMCGCDMRASCTIVVSALSIFGNFIYVMHKSKVNTIELWLVRALGCVMFHYEALAN